MRRDSVYGGNAEDAQPSEVVSPVASCGAKTMGGYEPVPGGDHPLRGGRDGGECVG